MSRRTRETRRVILHRLSDLIQDLLALSRTQSEEQGAEVFVLDFTDAFWQIPLVLSERRHFIGTYKGKLWKFKRSGQGSRNGHLSWAGPSSLLLRCTQGLLTATSSDVKKPAARAQLFVDDPAIAISGRQDFRDEVVAVAVMIWALLGFRLAFYKLQRGTNITWIGAQIDTAPDQVVTSIPETKMHDFLTPVEVTMKNERRRDP